MRRQDLAPARRRRSRWRRALVAKRRATRAPPPRKLRARPIHGHVSVAAHSRRRVAESRARTLLEIPLADAVQAPTIPSMNTRVSTILVASVLAFASACAKQEAVREIDWAKSALARNPAYEIVATDESTGVFTVRDTATGTMQTLRLEDLIAGPKPAKAVAKSEPVAEPVAEPVETPTVPEPAHQLVAGSNYRDGTGRERGARPVTRRGPGLHHHAQRTRARRPKPNNSAPTSNAAPIPSSARATGSCTSMARPSSSPAMPSSPRRAATSTSATRAFAPAASASLRARRACTSSTAPLAAHAVPTKRRRAPKSTWRVPRSPGSAVASILRP